MKWAVKATPLPLYIRKRDLVRIVLGLRAGTDGCVKYPPFGIRSSDCPALNTHTHSHTHTHAHTHTHIYIYIYIYIYTNLYTQPNNNPSAWNFLSPELEVTWCTVSIIIRVVLLSPCLCTRGVSLSSINYNQSHRVYINRKQQYSCLISNENIN